MDLWDYAACWTIDTKVGVVAQVLNGEKNILLLWLMWKKCVVFYSGQPFEMALLTFQLVK